MRSWPNPKSRVGRLTYWVTQVAPIFFISLPNLSLTTSDPYHYIYSAAWPKNREAVLDSSLVLTTPHIDSSSSSFKTIYQICPFFICLATHPVQAPLPYLEYCRVLTHHSAFLLATYNSFFTQRPAAQLLLQWFPAEHRKALHKLSLIISHPLPCYSPVSPLWTNWVSFCLRTFGLSVESSTNI